MYDVAIAFGYRKVSNFSKPTYFQVNSNPHRLSYDR